MSTPLNYGETAGRELSKTVAALTAITAPSLEIDLKGAILAAGTPLAAYAGSTPGITLDNSKAVGIRWKGGTLTSIWTYVDLPLDLDPTYPVTANFLVSKSGATGTDVVSMTIAAYAQTVGALEDAPLNIGAVSTALTGAQAALPAKTVTQLQAQIYLPPTVPARLSISITPSGTLVTDDVMLNACFLTYTRRPAVSHVFIDIRAAILAAGTPMAAWANNAGASAPGVTLDNAKAVGIRWNNQATLTAIWSSFELPANMDTTKPCVAVVLVSKSGATGGDTCTFDIGLYEQVAGALEDATTNLGGTTSAIGAPTASAKTVAKVTLGIAANVFTAGPHRVSVSIKPTDGTLGTDDAIINGFWIEYSKKPGATPIAAIDFKASILAAGTPMAAFANNGAASAPGVTLNNSKAVGIRWNNFATQTAILSERDLPLTFDATQAATLVLMASKSGATAADATSFTVAMWEQVPGALEDAGPSLTGTTSAIAAPTAAAKTVSRLTMTIPPNTFKGAPGRLSVSLKPADGTLGADDLLLCGCWIEFSAVAALPSA